MQVIQEILSYAAFIFHELVYSCFLTKNIITVIVLRKILLFEIKMNNKKLVSSGSSNNDLTASKQISQRLAQDLHKAMALNYRKIQQYVQELPDYRDGRISIPEYDASKMYIGGPKLVRRPSDSTHTTALLSKAHSQTITFEGKTPIQTLADIPQAPKIYSTDAGQYLIDTNVTSLLAIQDAQTSNHQLINFTPEHQLVAPSQAAPVHQAFHQYATYAERVVACHNMFYPEGSWDYKTDSLRCWQGGDQRTEYRQAFDNVRLSKVLDFYLVAQLILHIEESEIAGQSLSNRSSRLSSSRALTLFQTSGTKTQPQRSAKYPNILSAKHINWIINEIINGFNNARSGFGNYNMYQKEPYRLETPEETLEQQFTYVTLILCSKIKNTFSGTQLTALLGALTIYYGEDISQDTLSAGIAKHQAPTLRITAAANSQFNKYCLHDEQEKNHLNGQTRAFVASLAPYFTLDFLINQLKTDRDAAERLFTALFFDEETYKSKFPLYSDAPRYHYVLKGCGLFAYEDLIAICTTHLTREQSFFTEIYRKLTGRSQEEFFAQPQTSQDNISEAFASLELAIDSTYADVKKSYRKLALKWHPDKSGHAPDSEKYQKCNARFIAVNEAYAVLTTHFKNLEKSPQAESHENTEESFARSTEQPTNVPSNPTLHIMDKKHSDIVPESHDEPIQTPTDTSPPLVSLDRELRSKLRDAQATLAQQRAILRHFAVFKQKVQEVGTQIEAIKASDAFIKACDTTLNGRYSTAKQACKILAIILVAAILTCSIAIGAGVALAWWPNLMGFMTALTAGQHSALGLTLGSTLGGAALGRLAAQRLFKQSKPMEIFRDIATAEIAQHRL